MRLKSLALVSALSIMTACAAANQGSASGTPTQLTAADIQKANVATAYDAVDRLARRWFQDYSENATGGVRVYLNTNQELGGKEALRDIPAGDVLLLRYLRSADAQAIFGPTASGGAIIVTRR